MNRPTQTGYSQQGNARRRGFKSKDPFTFSIAQRIQQNRAPLQGIDDVPLPSQTTAPSHISARQSSGSHHINRVHAPQVVPPPVIPPHSVPAVADQRSGQRARRRTSSHYEIPTTISADERSLAPSTMLPTIIPTSSQSRNRLQSQPPPLSAIPPSAIPSGALIDSSRHYRLHSHNPPLVHHHHDHRPRSKSPVHRGSHSPDRGRSRSPRRRLRFERDSSPSGYRSTHPASSYLPYGIPESNPSSPSSLHSLRIEDIGDHFDAHIGRIHTEPETETLANVKMSSDVLPSPSLPSAMSSRRFSTDKERELREREHKKRLRERKQREGAAIEGGRQELKEDAREGERQAALQRDRERDRAVAEAFFQAELATANANAAVASASANANRLTSETSDTSSDGKPSSLRSYLRASDSPVPPQPYIPMPRPPSNMSTPTPPPAASSSIIPATMSMPEPTVPNFPLVNTRPPSRLTPQPNLPNTAPARRGRHRRMSIQPQSSVSTMTAVDSFPLSFIPERTPSSGSNPSTTRVTVPDILASPGSRRQDYRPPSGTTSHHHIYSRPNTTGGGRSYSATGRETLLDIPEDASLRISSSEVPLKVELPVESSSNPTSSTPSSRRDTTSSGRRGEEAPIEPDSPVVPPADAEHLPPGFVPHRFTPSSATPAALSAPYLLPEFVPTAAANSARPSIISSYEIGVEPPSKPVFPVSSNSVKYEKLATPNVHLEAKPTDRPSSPEVTMTDPEPLKLRDYVKVFVSDTLPQQMYLHILLRLPYFYFSRVERIFNEADLAFEEIVEMALQSGAEDNKTFQNNLSSNVAKSNYDNQDAPATSLSPGHQKLKKGWENFIDNMMREWKTLNLVSALILPAIMTMLQIEGIAQDPVTRYVAFWSLICALLSLLFCCTFTIRFAGMRKADRAAEWAREMQNPQSIFWNPWVMLAMPVVWLAWSIITYILCIMFFMWRVSAGSPADHTFSVSPSMELGFRIFICFVLLTGIIHGVLIISTLRRYGTHMDKAWTDRVERYIANPTAPTSPPSLPPPHSPMYHFPTPSHSSKTSLESDPIPYIDRAIPTSADSSLVTQSTSIPHRQPFTSMFPTETESGRIYLPPPHEFSRPWTPPPTQWKRTPSYPHSTSSSSREHRKRRTRSSSRRRSSSSQSSSSTSSPSRGRHRSIQDPRFPSTPPTLTYKSAVSEGDSRVPSHDEAVVANPSATPPIESSFPSQEPNTARTPPLRRSPSHPIPLQLPNQTIEEGEGELPPLQGDEDDQNFGFIPLSRLTGHDIDLFSDPNVHTLHTDTIQWTKDGGHPEGLTSASLCPPEVLHPDAPPLTSGNMANDSLPSECAISTPLTTASDSSLSATQKERVVDK